jgi:hypothetical protein
MASRIEDMLSKTISSFERRNKPLPEFPKPKRPEKITKIFLPTASPSISRSSRSPTSPQAAPSLTGSTPPAKLTDRRYLEQGPRLVSKATDDNLASLELEVSELQQQNKVLDYQNSGYKKLLREHRAYERKYNESTKMIKSALEAISTEIKIFEMAKANMERIGDEARRDWKSYIKESSRIKQHKEMIKIYI